MVVSVGRVSYSRGGKGDIPPPLAQVSPPRILILDTHGVVTPPKIHFRGPNLKKRILGEHALRPP